VGDEILPVREALKRLGLSDQYVLLAGGPQGLKFNTADHEPIGKLIAWAKKTTRSTRAAFTCTVRGKVGISRERWRC